MIASTTTGGGSSTRRRRNSSTAAIAQNVNIGAACVAFFPTTSQTATIGTIGTIGTALSGIFFGGSFCYTGAPAAALPLFDGGRRRGDLDYARASRDVAGSGSKSRRKPRALASRRPRPACRQQMVASRLARANNLVLLYRSLGGGVVEVGAEQMVRNPLFCDRSASSWDRSPRLADHHVFPVPAERGLRPLLAPIKQWGIPVLHQSLQSQPAAPQSASIPPLPDPKLKRVLVVMRSPSSSPISANRPVLPRYCLMSGLSLRLPA